MQTTTMRILTGKKIKKIEADTGLNLKGFLILESYDRFWITSRKMEEVDFNKLDLKAIGMFFGQIKDKKMELTKEAKVLFGIN